MRTWIQMALLAALGGAVGFAANALSPHPAVLGRAVLSAAEAGGGSCSMPAVTSTSTALAPWKASRISVDEAKGLCTACLAGFVDARGAHEFAHGHIANAVHLPPAGHPDEAAAVTQLRTYPLVVVYDGEYTCAVADDVAMRLRRAGLTDVRVLQGAWPGWVAAQGPASAGICGVCGLPEVKP
ncbi:MAG: rhodanese-like domain-containing protein [Deltaproteobacteria bacterium]|nr:rhodanese-like domain-containing protein [Deltaproteobacteria bacterium]